MLAALSPGGCGEADAPYGVHLALRERACHAAAWGQG